MTDTTPLDQLVDLLDLERIEVDIFRGKQPHEALQRVFGGQVAGQALVAAGRTVPADRPVHSLHAYFLRPGDPSVPIVYEVDRIRDGRSFTTRRVVAIQHGKPIFNLSASFQLVEPGIEHQAAMPDVVPPGGAAAARGADAALRRRARRLVHPPAPDRRPLRRRPAAGRQGQRPPRGPARRCGCAPTGRCPTTRCCTSAP